MSPSNIAHQKLPSRDQLTACPLPLRWHQWGRALWAGSWGRRGSLQSWATDRGLEWAASPAGSDWLFGWFLGLSWVAWFSRAASGQPATLPQLLPSRPQLGPAPGPDSRVLHLLGPAAPSLFASSQGLEEPGGQRKHAGPTSRRYCFPEETGGRLSTLTMGSCCGSWVRKVNSVRCQRPSWTLQPSTDTSGLN